MAITSLGDLNGDNYDDVMVGAPLWNWSRGKVYGYAGSQVGLSELPIGILRIEILLVESVYYGSETGLSETAVRLVGEDRFGLFGYCISLGDPDGDGHSEMMVSEPFHQSSTGKVYLYTI